MKQVSGAEESNRMGIRLEGGPFRKVPAGKMISEGVSLGAVQVPDGGQPIIFLWSSRPRADTRKSRM